MNIVLKKRMLLSYKHTCFNPANSESLGNETTSGQKLIECILKFLKLVVLSIVGCFCGSSSPAEVL